MKLNFIKKIIEIELSHTFDVQCAIVHFDKSIYKPAEFYTHSVSLPKTIKNSVYNRQAEFLAGRLAAKTSLRRLGFNSFTVHVGEQRQPIWPKGIYGSITHIEDKAICVAGSNVYIGIDLESWISFDTMLQIRDQIVISKELVLHKKYGIKESRLFTLIFSAKESIFKALFEQVGYYFDFKAVELIDISLDKELLTFKLKTNLGKYLTIGKLLQCQFKFYADCVLTIIIEYKKNKVSFNSLEKKLYLPGMLSN
ncbi:MAG: enterobactin synthetase component D [Francisellaceae bacterium]|jgi:enterobactin synthetase component D